MTELGHSLRPVRPAIPYWVAVAAWWSMDHHKTSRYPLVPFSLPIAAAGLWSNDIPAPTTGIFSFFLFTFISMKEA